MEKVINLSIFTPEKKFFQGEVKEITVETPEGRTTILPLHSALIAMLRPAISKFETIGGEEKRFFSSTGFLKASNNEIIMLCDSAEWPEDIEEARAREAKKRAEERLAKGDSIDSNRAELALLRAIKRIEALNKQNRD